MASKGPISDWRPHAREGALTRKAKAAGMGVLAYARKNLHAGGQTGDQARWYVNVLRKASRTR